ncbi:hypothetical protein ACWD3D_19860, partial [Streptomyces sp. NPDC002690]
GIRPPAPPPALLRTASANPPASHSGGRQDGRREDGPRMEKAGRPKPDGRAAGQDGRASGHDGRASGQDGRASGQGGRASSKGAPARDGEKPEHPERIENPERPGLHGGGDRPGTGDRSEGPTARR